MIGDGLNDAAALSLAHVSISPGTAVQATQNAADMILQGDGLRPIVEAVQVARQARRLVLQNFAFSALYNVCAVPLAAMGMVTPLIAAVAMSGSSLIVMLNALRLAGRKG
jgi:Cu2+-exporting ATPase